APLRSGRHRLELPPCRAAPRCLDRAVQGEWVGNYRAPARRLRLELDLGRGSLRDRDPDATRSWALRGGARRAAWRSTRLNLLAWTARRIPVGGAQRRYACRKPHGTGR